MIGTVGQMRIGAILKSLREVKTFWTRTDAGYLKVHADHELTAVFRVGHVPDRVGTDRRQGRFGHIATLYYKVSCK